MEQLLGDVKTSVDTLSDVAKKTNTLTENTNSLVTLVSLQLSQLTSLNASMAELNVKIKAAKGNAQVLASLQQEADAARKLATQSTASMLSTLVPQVSQQMQRLTRQYYDSVRKVSDPGHQGGSYFTHEAHVQWMKDRDRANAELRDNYDDAMKLLMPTADLLRQQMLRGLDQTDQDRSEAAEFASAINGNITPNLVVNEANYLDNLLKRLSSQHE